MSVFFVCFGYLETVLHTGLWRLGHPTVAYPRVLMLMCRHACFYGVEMWLTLFPPRHYIIVTLACGRLGRGGIGVSELARLVNYSSTAGLGGGGGVFELPRLTD